MTAETNVIQTGATLYPIAMILSADVAHIGHHFECLKDSSNVAFFIIDAFFGCVRTDCDSIILGAI
jgi:hypothetical protein